MRTGTRCAKRVQFTMISGAEALSTSLQYLEERKLLFPIKAHGVQTRTRATSNSSWTWYISKDPIPIMAILVPTLCGTSLQLQFNTKLSQSMRLAPLPGLMVLRFFLISGRRVPQEGSPLKGQLMHMGFNQGSWCQTEPLSRISREQGIPVVIQTPPYRQRF